MARSKLMNELKKSCQIAALAYEKNLTVQQAIEEYNRNSVQIAQNTVHEESMPDFSEAEKKYVLPPLNFMRQSGRPEENPGQKQEIAIIGAGLAGLVCAYRLYQSGFYPKIFEASNRPGGRCWTIYDSFADHQIAEHGGELIDSDHYAIINLAQEFGLELDNVASAQVCGTQPFYYFNGRPYNQLQASCAFSRIYPRLKKDFNEAGPQTTYKHCSARGWELDHMSVEDWINQTVPGGVESDFGKLLETAYTVEYGGEAKTQSALNIVCLLGSADKYPFRILGKSDRRYHIHGGNSRLVNCLAQALPKDMIQYEAPLTAIRRGCNIYQLEFLTGPGKLSAQADIVLLACPFAVLNSKVDYKEAGFSSRKIKAIEELGMGTNTKLNVQFEDRQWIRDKCNGTTFADTGYQSTWETTRAQPGEAGILAELTGGDIGASMSDPDDLALYTVQFLFNINKVLPGLYDKWNGHATIDYWTGYRWSLGSCPFYKIGGHTSIAGIEAQHEGNCFFAGDHTSLEYQGKMNGAVESGERAAGEILDVLMRESTRQN